MFENYLKLALRNLWKNKLFSLINIIGLSVGIAACITILLFVQYEKSFDAFHTKNIYRLNEVLSWEGLVQPQKVPLSMYPMGTALKNDFPEIKNTTHFRIETNASLKYKEEKIVFKQVLLADSNFLNLFNFELLKGDRKEALRNPRGIVLTPESAEKLFGKEDPIGKIVANRYSQDSLPFMITGIISVPKNSHLQFEALYTINTFIAPDEVSNWERNGMVTYLELNPHTDIKALEKKFPALLKKYGITYGYELLLQPLSDVHGESGDMTHDLNNFQQFNSEYTRVFFIIAIIVLIIGCINFMNLSTARSIGRAKEVGVRKSMGANRSQLAIQFIGESVLLSLIATVFAVGLVKLFLPYVNRLSAHELQFIFLADPLLTIKIIMGGIFVGVLSGIYPAFYLSAFPPTKVLKGSPVVNAKSFTRNVLVVGQFAGATFLIITTIFILRQLNYMQTRDTGFNRDQVVMLPGAYNKWYSLKDELLKKVFIKSVSGSTQKLGESLTETGIRFYGNGPEKDLATSNMLVDHDFLSLYKIKLLAGRNFSREGEGKEFIVNETLAKELLKDDPRPSLEALIGKRLILDEDTTSSIVGVCKDFNFNSLHHKIETLCLYNKKRWGYSDVCVKIDGARTEESLNYIETTWKKIMPNVPYEYQFLDEHFASLYETDKKVSRVVSILAGLAIIISCLGLLGLALYSAETRTREIGVRKVLGASVTNIVNLLSKDFLKLVIVANVIAWPLAWYAVTIWLRDYAYHIDISWWIFALAGFISLAIALVSVSSQTFKAALTNPVKSLRTE